MRSLHLLVVALVATTAIVFAAILTASGSGASGMRGSSAADGSGAASAIEAAYRQPVSMRSGSALPPLKASVLFPDRGARAGVNGTFSVDLSIQARRGTANRLLAGYTSHFIDPNSPEFHPGANASAPGLVVLLSTTPTIEGTPLQGPNTNLAGVFQINDVEKLDGLKRSFNSWLVGVPGFFGRATTAQLKVYAVRGTAPAVVTGDEHPISNVVSRTFTIAG